MQHVYGFRVLACCLALAALPFQAQGETVGLFPGTGFERIPFPANQTMDVRSRITWGAVQPRDHMTPAEFRWDSSPVEAELKVPNRPVYPVIRLYSDWAVVHGPNDGDYMDTPDSQCGGRPIDLRREAPLAVGSSYSKLFYNFMFQLGKKYKDAFDIIVIENEMNDPHFWCYSSSPGDYVRVLITAQTALRDSGSKTRVSDGGIQGFALARVIAKNLIEVKHRPGAALSFYQQVFGDEILNRMIETFAALRGLKPATMTATQKASAIQYEYATKGMRVAAGERKRGDLIFLRAKELVGLQLWKYTDIANFHMYEGTGASPELVGFIRENAFGKRIWSNEVGAMDSPRYYPNETARHAAARVLLKRFTWLKALQVSPVLWFAYNAPDTDGWFVEESGGEITEAAYAYLAVLAHLSEAPKSVVSDVVKQESKAIGRQFIFKFATFSTEVLWLNPGVPYVTREVPAKCQLYGMGGNLLPASTYRLGVDPVFLRCR